MLQKDNGEILIGSTTEENNFDTNNDLLSIKKLAQGAMTVIPMLKNVNIKRCWAGLRPATPDELPIIGPDSEVNGYLNANGHFRTGILMSAITGKIIYELALGKPTSIDIKPFLASRFYKNGCISVKNTLNILDF